MSEVEAAYLAGIIDGEGTIMLYRRRGGPGLRLAVANTDARLLDWCVVSTAVGAVVWKKPGSSRHSVSGIWAANADAAESTIRQLLPYLVIKRQQAELALDFRQRIRNPAEKADPTWQEDYRLRMCAMNARGPKATEAATTTD